MSATRNDAVIRPEPSKSYRWLVLIFVSLPMFGNYYIYDSINPVTDLMKAQLHFTDQQIGRLNSIYSVAAVIVLLIGGILVDRLGTKKSTFIFAFICLVASVLTVATTIPAVILASRFVLGLGAEPLIVAVTTALAKWFKGKELSFAFGIICVVAAIIYWAFESYAERNYHLGEAGEVDKLVWRDLFKFGASYWFIVALCMTFYSAVYPFRTFAVKFFIEGHGTSRELGGFLNSVIPQAAMFATPLFGLLIDKIGKRALLMTLGSILLIPAFLLMLPGMHVPLYFPSILLGIAFSLVPAVMWPSVAYIVDQKRLGTAYGLMTMIQQIGFFIMNETLGNLNDRYGASSANPGGYSPMIYLLSLLGIVGVIFAYLLKRSESGPHAHGLETITTSSAPKSEAPA